MESSSLHVNLEDWLRTQGYPLEMRAAQLFHKRGWFFHHSRRYKDPTLGKEREIDLIAFYDDPVKDLPRVSGHFVIECKWTPKKPWVIFTAARRTLTPIGYFRSTPMTDTADLAFKSLTSKNVQRLPLFSGFEEGYSIVQAFSKDTAVDAAYSAVQSVVSAADYFAQSMSEKTKHSIIYIPTVILDGELFQCSLNNDGDVSLKQVEMGVLIHHSAADVKCVHIVREPALEEFADRAENTVQSLWKFLRG